MKIKTVVYCNPDVFDDAVNKYLSEGYILNHHEIRTEQGRPPLYYALLMLREEDDE